MFGLVRLACPTELNKYLWTELQRAVSSGVPKTRTQKQNLPSGLIEDMTQVLLMLCC